MNFYCLKIIGTIKAVVDFNGLRRVQLRNNNVQGFSTKWDEVRFSMAPVPDAHL